MTATRFQCTLTTASEPPCHSYARVTVKDSDGDTVRGCPSHAIAALDHIIGAYVDWEDSKGLNEWERKALELTEERTGLTRSFATSEPPILRAIAVPERADNQGHERSLMGSVDGA